MSERGAVGRATFDRVQQLVNNGMTRSAAFAAVAEESGRSAATVATSFYRVARQRPDGGGVKRRPRKRRDVAPARGPGRGRGRRAATTSTDALIAEVQRAIEALGSHLREVEKEARSLRAHSDRIDQIRRMLG
jgi:hypothetical protein